MSRWLDGVFRINVGLIAAGTAGLAVELAVTFLDVGARGARSTGPDSYSETEPPAPVATFDERFDVGEQSLAERLAEGLGFHGDPALPGQPEPGQSNADLTEAALPADEPEERPVTEASLEAGLPSDFDAHTAIYDIAARTVYLPSGKKLEAHSGLGSRLDDPRYVTAKMRGPTPPNVYNLVLRERLFHGVRAIRLKPVDGGRMFGRDGILAHSFMLGPSGQSNGCVSFRDYPAFLHAFLRGEFDRLVVVDHLTTATTAKVGAKTSANTTTTSGG